MTPEEREQAIRGLRSALADIEAGRVEATVVQRAYIEGTIRGLEAAL